jgi:predicted nucleic acid-binding protein
LRLVIADTSPINYLLLIGHIDLLPSLFTKVVLPLTVQTELRHPKAPPAVKQWIASPPVWAELATALAKTHLSSSLQLDAGEEDAIALALEMHADLVLMDDEEGASVAPARPGSHRHVGCS